MRELSRWLQFPGASPINVFHMLLSSAKSWDALCALSSAIEAPCAGGNFDTRCIGTRVEKKNAASRADMDVFCIEGGSFGVVM